MNDFRERFETACRTRGAEYVSARDAIVAGDFGEDLRRSALEGSPHERRTAETLLAWREHRDVFVEIGSLARGEFSRKGTMLGSSPVVRGQAIASRGPDVTLRVIEILCRSGEAEDAEARSGLFLALGILRDARAVGPLVEILEGDQPIGMICGAIEVLCKMREPAGLEWGLRIAFDRKWQPAARRTAVYGLSEYADPRVVPCLLRVLSEEFLSATEKQTAAFALAKLGRAESREGVLTILEQPLPDEIRLPLIQLLGRIGLVSDGALLEELADREPRLADLARDSARRVLRRSAAEAKQQMNRDGHA